ncbi:MAG: hypothetical protein JXA24_05010 [Proteobacteria bacterium]|nr:hypothetical protein [Pseudomonadota bacterium]
MERMTLEDVSARKKRPMLIAHRGAGAEAPENTLPAIKRALDLGADGIEFDVQLTRDKVPVCTHDDDLSLRTLFEGYLHATPFETVRNLDAGSQFSTKFAGTPMPTLPEVLELIAPHEVLTVIDLKYQPGFAASVAQLVGGLLGEFRMRGRVLVATSCWRIVNELRRRHPKLPRALTIALPPFPFFPTRLFAKFEGITALHPSLRALWPSLAAKMRRTGLEINAWTANEPHEFDLCSGMGVDGIFTDDIAAAKRHFGAAETM